MFIKRILTTIAVSIALLCSTVHSAQAATATGTLTVTASVAKNCKLSNSTLAFGAYDPVVTNATTDLDQATTMTITCTKGSSGITLGFGPSANAPTGCTSPQRCMANAGTYLNYQIYSDSSRSAVWTTAITETVSGGITTPTVVTIYGRVVAGQDATIGAAYSDTVLATVNF